MKIKTQKIISLAEANVNYEFTPPDNQTAYIIEQEKILDLTLGVSVREVAIYENGESFIFKQYSQNYNNASDFILYYLNPPIEL